MKITAAIFFFALLFLKAESFSTIMAWKTTNYNHQNTNVGGNTQPPYSNSGHPRMTNYFSITSYWDKNSRQTPSATSRPSYAQTNSRQTPSATSRPSYAQTNSRHTPSATSRPSYAQTNSRQTPLATSRPSYAQTNSRHTPSGTSRPSYAQTNSRQTPSATSRPSYAQTNSRQTPSATSRPSYAQTNSRHTPSGTSRPSYAQTNSRHTPSATSRQSGVTTYYRSNTATWRTNTGQTISTQRTHPISGGRPTATNLRTSYYPTKPSGQTMTNWVPSTTTTVYPKSGSSARTMYSTNGQTSSRRHTSPGQSTWVTTGYSPRQSIRTSFGPSKWPVMSMTPTSKYQVTGSSVSGTMRTRYAVGVSTSRPPTGPASITTYRPNSLVTRNTNIFGYTTKHGSTSSRILYVLKATRAR